MSNNFCNCSTILLSHLDFALFNFFSTNSFFFFNIFNGVFVGDINHSLNNNHVLFSGSETICFCVSIIDSNDSITHAFVASTAFK
jgi:hypothetical protein